MLSTETLEQIIYISSSCLISAPLKKQNKYHKRMFLFRYKPHYLPEKQYRKLKYPSSQVFYLNGRIIIGDSGIEEFQDENKSAFKITTSCFISTYFQLTLNMWIHWNKFCERLLQTFSNTDFKALYLTLNTNNLSLEFNKSINARFRIYCAGKANFREYGPHLIENDERSNLTVQFGHFKRWISLFSDG